MNVVLYTIDLEPITILDLPLGVLEFGEREGMVCLEAMAPLSFHRMCDPGYPDELTFHQVRLRFHKLRFYGKESWMITTDDEELAMTLKPSWLPGQQGEVNRQRAAIRDLSNALLRAMQGGYGS